MFAEHMQRLTAGLQQEAGFDDPFSGSRPTGFSFLAKRQLVIGDSFILIEDDLEQITYHPRAIDDAIIMEPVEGSR